jgi:hypothetical protein
VQTLWNSKASGVWFKTCYLQPTLLVANCRNERWDLTFGSNDGDTTPQAKAISILEHILLVTEEGYATQHWENYVKWSNLLLNEYREMYQVGQLHHDPDKFWDQSRLDYFDSFVLPLAEKVNGAGVLGSMGDEFYTYASQNRQELESLDGIANMKELSGALSAYQTLRK